MQTKKPIVNPVVVLRKEFDDWAVLFTPDTAEAVGINPVGVAIWELLDQQIDIHEIADTIRQDFADVPGSATEEIETFVNDLIERGFLGAEL
ncbi:MAG: PqqD family peptide modification chaperone [Desulfobacterales bacterium]|nr:PqqD family peptide modification chaperone [Desulfobacterales bacterium]